MKPNIALTHALVGAGALVMLVLLVAVLPMFYYVRVTTRGDVAS
jgi:uncharacterized MnhB-related membrane protein